jgi:hypothetical protein
MEQTQSQAVKKPQHEAHVDIAPTPVNREQTGPRERIQRVSNADSGSLAALRAPFDQAKTISAEELRNLGVAIGAILATFYDRDTILEIRDLSRLLGLNLRAVLSGCHTILLISVNDDNYIAPWSVSFQNNMVHILREYGCYYAETQAQMLGGCMRIIREWSEQSVAGADGATT